MDQQSTEVLLIIYVLVFVCILLAFDGARQFLSRTENSSEARNRRMRMMKNGATSDEVLAQLFYSKKVGRGFSLIPDVSKSLRQAGLPIPPALFYILSAVLGGFVFVLAQVYLPAAFALPAALVSAVGIPQMVLQSFKQKRMEKLISQLPDALELMARGLRVGHPLNVTVASVANDMPDPIGTEFGLIEDQVSFGDDIVSAFRGFADRVDLEDARYLSVSVGIQHGTGGNLSRVLTVLAKVIRDRATMRKKIKAISSEGRLSALILSILPFGIFGSIHMTTPEFYGSVQSEPLFMPFAITIISLIVIQGLILRKLVTFKF